MHHFHKGNPIAFKQIDSFLRLCQKTCSPLVSGGSFYTAEALDQARQHYFSSWAPILHATVLWLNSNELLMTDEGPASLSRPVTPTSMGQSTTRDSAKSEEDIRVERLYLILGQEMAQKDNFIYLHIYLHNLYQTWVILSSYHHYVDHYG